MPPLRCVVDTNVVATASGVNPGAGTNCQLASAEALHAVMREGHLFLDDGGLILAEYLEAVDTGQPEAGGAFVRWVLQNQWAAARVSRVTLTPRTGAPTGFEELPPPKAGTTYDPEDEKFLAVAAAHPEHPAILQAFDSKWWGWQDSLSGAGVSIHFLCPHEIEAKYREKMGEVTEFFRFPRTPHLLWLGTGEARDDKVLPPDEVQDLLSGPVLVEEKLDGANVGISVSDTGDVRAQNRGAYLDRHTCHPQFKPLFRWLDLHRHALTDVLHPDLIVFGEWCYAVHSVRYTKLPDWFLAFDIYDRQHGAFWSAARRNDLIDRLGLARVPEIAQGQFTVDEIVGLLGTSALSNEPAEGVYVRRDEGEKLVGRAKLVRPEFVQQIDAHWSERPMETNALLSGAKW